MDYDSWTLCLIINPIIYIMIELYMYHNPIYNTFNISYHVSQILIKMTLSIEGIHDKNIYTLMKLYNASYNTTEDRNDIYIKGVMSKYLTIRIINYMTELTCGITLFSMKSLCIIFIIIYYFKIHINMLYTSA